MWGFETILDLTAAYGVKNMKICRPRILNWKITHTPNYKKLEAIFCRDYVSLLLLHLFIYFKR